VEIDNAAAVIVGLFAILALILAHARFLMRDLARTAEAWRELQDALRGSARRERAGQDNLPKCDCKDSELGNGIDRQNSFEEPWIDAAPPGNQAENL
jgi:hypothetical protein